jgi:serine/threonine protein kinase/tetratricopeptide (TPR) repeat protein
VDEDWERFSPGNIFANRYTIIEEVGHGGMGRVFKAIDRSLGITVAIKVIRPEYALNPRVIELFKQETVLARSISSENVVRVHDLGEAEKTKYISMDFVEGQNLRDLIHASGSLTISTAVKFGQQICSALSAAHKTGIIHRDLKPSNIMIDKTGRVRVMDFGLAKTIDREDAGGAKAIVGTPEYLSPEQARGENLDQRTDIYALGLVLYEMVTGRPVFEAESLTGYIQKHCAAVPKPPSRVNHMIPAGLETLILKCLRKDRNERYQKAEDVCQALDGIIAPESRKPKTARSRLLRISVGAAACALLGFIAYWIFIRPEPTVSSIRKAVAVMNFENLAGDPSPDKWRAIRHLLVMELEQSKFLRVVPRARLLDYLNDFHIQDTGDYAQSDLDKIASREKVDYFLLGGYLTSGERCQIDVRIIDARLREIIASRSFEAAAFDDILNRCDDISIWAKSELQLTKRELATDFDQELKRYTTQSIDALVCFFQGLDFYEKGDYRRSTESYLKAVAFDGNFALAYARLAMNFPYEGRFEEAKKYLLQAMSLRKNLTTRERLLIEGDYFNLYECDYPKAIESYETLLKTYPDDEMALEHQGAIYRNTEDWDKAAACFERLHGINPKDRVTIANLSFIAQAMGQYEKGARILEDNRSVIPTPEEFYAGLANCLFCQGRTDQALAELQTALSLAADRLGSLRLLGHIRTAKGEYRDAEAAYRLLLGDERSITDKVEGHFWLGWLDIMQGRYAAGVMEIEEGLKLARSQGLPYDEADFLILGAYLYYRKGKLAKAHETALKARQKSIEIRFREHEIKALHLMGMCETRLGNLSEAHKTLLSMEQIIKRIGYPKLLRHCHHLQGMIAGARESWDEAVAAYSKAVETLPSQHLDYDDAHGLYLDALASALYERGDWDAAKVEYEKITQLTTGRITYGDAYARSLYRLGRIYQERNEPAQAKTYFQSFLNVFRDADPGLTEVADARSRLAALS